MEFTLKTWRRRPRAAAPPGEPAAKDIISISLYLALSLYIYIYIYIHIHTNNNNNNNNDNNIANNNDDNNNNIIGPAAGGSPWSKGLWEPNPSSWNHAEQRRARVLVCTGVLRTRCPYLPLGSLLSLCYRRSMPPCAFSRPPRHGGRVHTGNTPGRPSAISQGVLRYSSLV